jgi:hypothetical protein
VPLLNAQPGGALLGLALIQLLLALWTYGRLPGLRAAPHPVGTGHRLIGMYAFLCSVPIAQQCIIAYRVSLTGPREALHSLADCFLYGAFVAKVVVVRRRRWPGLGARARRWRARHGDRPGLVLGGVLRYLNGFRAPGL